MALKKILTSQQFELAARLTTLRPHTLDMARDVLVFGQSQSSVAVRFCVTKSAVSQVVKQVWDAFSPPGFVVASTPLPKSVLPFFIYISEYALLHPDDFDITNNNKNIQSLLISLIKQSSPRDI